MSIAAMTQVWHHAPVGGGELLVLLALADFANDRGEAWPSVRTLAHRARLTPRRVQQVLRELQASGLIVAGTVSDSGTTRYKVALQGGEIISGGGEKISPRGVKRASGGGRSGLQGGDEAGFTQSTIEPPLNRQQPQQSTPEPSERDPRLAAAAAAGAWLVFQAQDITPEWLANFADDDTPDLITEVIKHRRQPDGSRIRLPTAYATARDALVAERKAAAAKAPPPEPPMRMPSREEQEAVAAKTREEAAAMRTAAEEVIAAIDPEDKFPSGVVDTLSRIARGDIIWASRGWDAIRIAQAIIASRSDQEVEA